MLKPTHKVAYQVPQNDYFYSAHFDGKSCHVEGNFGQRVVASLEVSDTHAGNRDSIRLKIHSPVKQGGTEILLAIGLEHLFSHFEELKKVTLVGETELLHPFSQFLNIPNSENKELEFSILRKEFYESPRVWHRNGRYSENLDTWVETQARKHPKRPASGQGTLYRRYVSSIQKTISFRTIDIENDLERFHGWHNQQRVYDLWDLNQSREELRTYLKNGLQDAHQFPMILEIDGEPAGYFEIYWAAEDRIAPYYDSDPYDRGFHFLIGERKFLGIENTDAILRSVMHFMYLENSRTKRLVAEPRSDNKKVLKYVQIVPGGWNFIKEFDFPHKRAALLMSNREEFFTGGAL